MIERPWGVHVIADIYDGAVTQWHRGGHVFAPVEPYTANRLTAAWWVLTGRAYALQWPAPGDLERALWSGAMHRNEATQGEEFI